MNLSASALLFALVVGLLGTWLFLTKDKSVHQDYRVGDARVACDKARHETKFGGRPHKELQAREDRLCGEYEALAAKRIDSEKQADKETAELKKSIEKAVASKEGEASKTELALREAASAVAQTATAIRK